jgi:hypothetical protein
MVGKEKRCLSFFKLLAEGYNQRLSVTRTSKTSFGDESHQRLKNQVCLNENQRAQGGVTLLILEEPQKTN